MFLLIGKGGSRIKSTLDSAGFPYDVAGCPGYQVHQVVGIAWGFLDGPGSYRLSILAGDTGLPENGLQHGRPLVRRYPLLEHLAVAVDDDIQDW
jgi:hypothetical protein